MKKHPRVDSWTLKSTNVMRIQQNGGEEKSSILGGSV